MVFPKNTTLNDIFWYSLNLEKDYLHTEHFCFASEHLLKVLLALERGVLCK